MEFAREKGTLFDKWCVSAKAENFQMLRELLLLEDFKKTLPDRLVVYLNEQKVKTLSDAAVLADEFVLTHKVNFTATQMEKRVLPSLDWKVTKVNPSKTNKEFRECFYCHKPGHVISNCLTLKRKTE